MSAASKVKRTLKKARTTLRFEQIARARQLPIEADTVLYEAFAGSGVLDNPEAIFREILASPDLSHLRHVWALDKSSAHDGVRREFSGDRRVRFVERDSADYWKALSTSGTLVNNATFPVQFGKRPGQVYLNTWHGTPLKAMGYDMPDGARESANTIRNFVQADYLLAQNDFMAEQMYGRAYKLDGVFRGAVVHEGYPRVDRQRLTADDVQRTRDALEVHGLALGSRRIVLYAPTWRGDSFSNPADDLDALVRAVADLQERLGDEYAVLLKTHQIVERFVGGRRELARILVPGSMPTNVVLGVADSLVTDYSSIFFDFLASGRRIVFHTPDRDSYDAARGRYFTDDELPGAVCETADQVADAIIAAPGDPLLRESTRDAWQERFTRDGAGQSARRVVDIVFRQRTRGYDVRRIAHDDRASILIHAGNLASNGITASLLSLLRALPPERFDVSIAYTRSQAAQQLVNSEHVPAHVRQFPRIGGMNGTKWQQLRRHQAYRGGRPDAHRLDPDQRALWDDEWARCFGDVTFDRIVDFSGYSPLWAQLLLHSPEAPRAIWLHNDMAAEVHREVGGKHPLEVSLPAIFGTYPSYDDLAAVSPRLARINEKSLPDGVVGGRRIHPVANVVDAHRIRTLAAGEPYAGESPHLADPESESITPEWARDLVAPPSTEPAPKWFVTVGRYTNEKNHERLITAFAAVHRRHPEARLLIVGHGPLQESLARLIVRLGLVTVAHITGALSNPFSVMSRADCFVLSSDYEGQPMVLLEAAVLDMPIVSTRFATVEDALPDDTIHIVEQDAEALAEGMVAFLDGRVQPSHLDSTAYNERAVAGFLEALRLPVVARPTPAPATATAAPSASEPVSAPAPEPAVGGHRSR